MISFHLTELSNLPSILRLGLIGTRPRLEHHLEVFRKDGLQGDKVVYCWGISSKLDKYARDMIYCKQWIHPRNGKSEGYDFSRDRRSYFKNERYVLLKVDTREDESNYLNLYTHWQTGNNDRYDSLFNMHTEFEHSDKPMIIFSERVESKYIIPIGLYDSEVTKQKRLLIRQRGVKWN